MLGIYWEYSGNESPTILFGCVLGSKWLSNKENHDNPSGFAEFPTTFTQTQTAMAIVHIIPFGSVFGANQKNSK